MTQFRHSASPAKSAQPARPSGRAGKAAARGTGKPSIDLARIPASAAKVALPALSTAPLRIAGSVRGNFAVAWRTYTKGQLHDDDGRIWLLERFESGKYRVRSEHCIRFANTVAVADNGMLAWIRAENHRGPTHSLYVLDTDSNTIIEEEPVPGAVESLGFSESCEKLAGLCSTAPPSVPRLFAWDMQSARRVAAFPILLTDHVNRIEACDDSIRVRTPYDTHAEYGFDGVMQFDNRLDEICSFWSFIGLKIERFPTEQLCYVLQRLDAVRQDASFATESLDRREYALRLRTNLLNMLGEAETQEPDAAVYLPDDIVSRLKACVKSGRLGNDIDAVAANLLGRALDFVEGV